MVSDKVAVDKAWLDKVDAAVAAAIVTLARIDVLLRPKAWQPWQLERAKIAIALTEAEVARKRLETAMVPFKLEG